ncbi:DUF1330 domain-containing protein [Falsihalocynthiibacter arcticus]|uniref:DUF1330 domain-containing protein n=1 Tax=Falsihalocynthiibacter arcticus TaxID=1579316 RepID=A0A126V3S2_9RHOB|nr:DUF1330 domain-containing protein [Falsihalocynthiibacter arcticus]AML52595.1 hypothetical protein RC74_16140 [Falsihalocynthiibacter arcticus]
MSVYLIADIKITDDRWVPEYAANVHKLVEKHGGKYLSRSGNIKTLEGADAKGRLSPSTIKHRASRRSLSRS